MKTTFEPSDSSGATKMEVPEKTPPTYADLGIDKGLIKEMPKNEGGWTQKKTKDSCGTKLVPQEIPPTYAELGIDKKDAAQIKLGGLIKEMPKNEGTKGQPFDRGFTGGTKTEPPINKGKSETPPPTYYENHS